jgi:glycine hydroxymethyltransferase
MNRGYEVISGGTDNHSMLIDLRSKGVNGKEAENALVKADITVNKNMVPFDTETPFVTSGIRVGTAALTTRGFEQNEIPLLVDLIDRIIDNTEDENEIAQVKGEINQLMIDRPLFK